MQLSQSSVVVTVTPLIGYLSQLHLIQKNKSVGSFSIDVCAILLMANILRIIFWFTNRFALNLLLQSFLIIFIQLFTLKICIHLGYKQTQEQGFWRWNNFRSFVMFLIGFVIVMTTTTYFAIQQHLQNFGQIVGLTALSLEAALGFPQISINLKNKSTEGLSYFMVFLWLIGDHTKTVYFVLQKQPYPFLLCGIIQSISDIILIVQIIKYWKNQKPAVPIPLMEELPLK